MIPDVFQLGDVFEISDLPTSDGVRWLVVGVSEQAATLVRMPEGETSQGFGRTWFEEDCETRVLPVRGWQRFSH